jgi:hypothetical protein
MSELNALKYLRAAAGQSVAEIDTAIITGDALELDGWELGRVLKFTFDEYRLLGSDTYGRRKARHVATIRPRDVTKSTIESHLKAVHRPGKRLARQKQRAAQAARRRQASDVDCRASAILTVLTDSWRSVKNLMGDLSRSAAFRSADGKRLTGNSLRQAVLRELKSRLKDRIETLKTKEKHGREMLLVRLRQ